MNNKRKTSISWVEAGKIYLRGYKIEDLIGNMSLGEAIFLVLTGRLPEKKEALLIEAIMISVIDHGVSPPSTIVTVTATNTGADLNAAVAAGILTINKFHGGAIEEAMTAIHEAYSLQTTDGLSEEEAAERVIESHIESGLRVSGFGHRFHGEDPRTVSLFSFAEKLGFSGKFVSQAKAIEKVFKEKFAKDLPINADGAIAALLCEINFPKVLANGLFIASRVIGLIAHAIEERTNTPMRTVKIDEYDYEGELGKEFRRNKEFK